MEQYIINIAILEPVMEQDQSKMSNPFSIYLRKRNCGFKITL